MPSAIIPITHSPINDQKQQPDFITAIHKDEVMGYRIFNHHRQNRIIIASLNVGLTTVWHRRGKYEKKVFYITDLHVDEAYRRKGLATKLMREMIEDLGHMDLFLCVQPFGEGERLTVEGLEMFYGEWGFTYYHQYEQGLMMRKGVPYHLQKR